MFKKILVGLALFLTMATPVLAGGQLFSLQADTDGWKSDAGYGRVLRIFANPEWPCKGTEITFKFVDPKDGDYIMTGSGNATFTINEDRGTNGCGTYAKMISRNSETRLVTMTARNGDRVWDGNNAPTIKVDFDGQYHGENHYDYYDYTSYTGDPYSPRTYPSSVPQPSNQPVVKPSNYPPAYPSSKPLYYPVAKPTSTPTEQPSASASANPAIDELNQKIKNLQVQLDQSKQQQNFLEARLNSILSWIKTVFPFFK